MLISQTDNMFIKQCLYKWLDWNNIKIINVDYQKNPGVKTFPFENNQITNGFISKIVMDVLPPCKQTKDKNKIIHLLSKSCPKRCQIRNLKEIVLQYATEDNDTYFFLIEVMKKSIFGTYNHCKEMLCFEARHVFYTMFQYQLLNKDFFLKWFANNNHQIFIFFCLKEFLCDAIQQMKTVHNFIEKKWKWTIFEKQVVDSMDSCRRILNTTAKREYHLLSRSDWILSIETFLYQISKQHIKLFRTTNTATYLSKLQVLVNKYIITENHLLNPFTKISDFLWNVIQRTTNYDVHLYALQVSGIPSNIIDGIRSETFGGTDFIQLNLHQLFVIKEFCRLNQLATSTSIFVLPKHFYENQKQALLKKEHNDNNHNHAIGYICFICNDIKYFLTKFSTSSRHSNKLARGSLRVVVDNDIEMEHNGICLNLVCGRKPERHVKNSKKKWKDDQKAISRKIFKEKQRNFLSKQCIQTPLEEIDLLGHVVKFNNKIIMLCTVCANVCVVDPESFKHGLSLNCKVCQISKKQQCIKCQVDTICNRILVYNQKKVILHKAPMCNNCTNVYAQKQPVII